MAKPPKTRHSKSRKDPVTIDLDPADVKRESADAEAAAASEAPASEAEQPVKPNAADEALADQAAAPSPEESKSSGEAAAGAEVKEGVAAEAVRPELRTAAPAYLAAGLAGAVLALLGATALQWAGALPFPSGYGNAADGASLDAMRADIEGLKRELASGVAPEPSLVQSMEDSRSRIDGLAAIVEQLRADLAAQAAGAAADPAAMQALEARIAELEAAAGDAPESDAVTNLAGRVDELAARVNSAAESLAAQSARLDALEQRLGETAERVEAQAAEPSMALAVAATALKSAIDRGEPFMAELETYAAIAPDVPRIAALRDMAASGVPTREEIEAELAGAAGRMVAAAAAPADSDASFLERMFTSAQSLVEVRPVGSVEGDSPGAIVARMEVALRQGDYAEAIEESESLPQPAQAAGQEFMDKVRARQAADRLIAEALAGAAQMPEGEG